MDGWTLRFLHLSLEECQRSDLHHYLTSHGVGLVNHILVESYDILVGCSTGQRSTKQFDGCETILVFLRRAIDSGEHCCLGLDMPVFPLCKCYLYCMYYLVSAWLSGYGWNGYSRQPRRLPVKSRVGGTVILDNLEDHL